MKTVRLRNVTAIETMVTLLAIAFLFFRENYFLQDSLTVSELQLPQAWPLSARGKWNPGF